jgi:hypothetical protein
MAEPASTTPDPADDQESFETIKLGEWTWTLAHGAFVVELPSAKLKLDEQKAAGTDKAKIKVSGVDNAEGSIKFMWTRWQAREQDNAQLEMLWDHNPNNPKGKGKPIDVRNGFFANDGIHQIMVTHYDKLVVQGDYRERVMHFKEWTEEPKAVAGATTTPKAPTQWYAGDQPPATPAGGKQPTGFAGPAAPKTSPK